MTRPGAKVADVAASWAYEHGRRFRLHPTRCCLYCGARLMLGDPAHRTWHCSRVSEDKGEAFMRHFEASVYVEQGRRV